MKSIITAAALSLLLAAPALAQQKPVTDPAKVEPGTYSVEPYHTRVMFGVSHFGFTTYYGNFTGASGTLVLDPKAASKSTLDVTVPVNTISTTNTKLDGELAAADWLDATKFPTMEFKASKVTPVGHGHADVAGELTLHGVTKPVVFKVTFNGAGVNPIDKKYTAGFEVSGEIKRSDFGVTKYVPLVGDDVQLIISAAFEKQG